LIIKLLNIGIWKTPNTVNHPYNIVVVG